MEKHAKPKTNILKFLPKAASAVTFQNLPFSPGREKRSDIFINKLKAHAGRGFSGPIISIIPDEARRKSKNDSFENQEPTSPKVSCMGQIKKHKANHKKKMNHMKKVSPPKDTKPAVSSPREVKKQPSKFRRLFSGVKPARKSDVSDDHDQKLPDRAPALSQMKRFASGHTRDAFSNFDWTAHQIAPLDSDHRNYYSDEERGDSDQEEEEEDYIIPFSAPMTVGGGGVALQPRKEVNLWKRRTMNPPRRLQLNPMVDEVH